MRSGILYTERNGNGNRFNGNGYGFIRICFLACILLLSSQLQARIMPPPPPTVITMPATGITATSATLNAFNFGDGSITTTSFDYGTDPTFTVFTNVFSDVTATTSGIAHMVVVTGLFPGTTYYFRANISNINGTGTGSVLSFTTLTPSIPTFANGTPQSDTICANSSNNDINAFLTVNDISGASETWSVVLGPFNGSVSGLPTTGSVVTSSVTPTGVTYTPTPGFSGTDFIKVVVDNGTNTDTTTIAFFVNPPISITLGTNPAICQGALSASISFSGALNIGPDTVMFSTVGSTTWMVPPGISSLNFDVQGARGGRDNVTLDPNPGNGGRIQGALNVFTGEQLNLYIGGVGGDGTGAGAVGGFNGGGNSNFYLYGSGGAGGGASDIRVGGTALSDRIVVAGGGGGNGWDSPGALAGGAGGNTTGGSSAMNGGGNVAGGGTPTLGGAGATYTVWTPGMDGAFGIGGDGSVQGISGGGGGGYYGGGGGVWTGGGGGSSYADAISTSSVTYTQGFDTGKGQIVLTYNIPGTYTIVWDAAAHGVGFRDTTDVLPSSSSFPITVPAGAPAIAPSSVYSGTLTVSAGTCSSNGYPFSVKIYPTPDVAPIANQAVCNGGTTTDIIFSGSVSSATYNWVNNNTSIGLAANGTGHIASFTPSLSATSAVTATITVTPIDSGCAGTPLEFTITDNPIPVLNSTTTPPSVCDSTLFHYLPTSATDSVIYTWSRADVAGITNTGTTGSDSTMEYLVNTTNDDIPVVYQYVLDYKGCMDTQNVTVIVYPHPILTSTLTPSPVCSGTLFRYVPETNVLSGVNITWSRPGITGIINDAQTGVDSILETLTDTTANPVTVIYTDTLNYNSCIYTQDITVTVNPMPILSSPAIAASTCDTVRYTAMSATGGTSFSWTRDLLAGITPATGAGADSVINEGLANATADPQVVTYTYTLTANGCSNAQSITDTVKPTPTLNSPLLDSTCNNTVFLYSATSATSGTTFAWVRDTTIGISNSPDSAMSNAIAEILINTTPNIVPVTYVYTLTAAGCMNTQNVTLNVKPTPMLSNNPSVAGVCDSSLFRYVPASATSGAAYTWTRAYVPGISNFGMSGIDSVHEYLKNTTYVNVNVVYHYIIVANGCTNTEDVTLTVHPTPMLSSDTTETICSGGIVIYYPTSYTPGTSFTWMRSPVAGITPDTKSGDYFITDTLTSSLSTTATVEYMYTLTANGCSNMQNYTVIVNSSPATPGISTFPANAACNNTMYQNFGTSTAPDAGMEYSWTANNATVFATGAGGQYCLVNFTTPGVATVYLLVNNTSTGCVNNNAYSVNVSGTENTHPEVIYVNGQFICQANDADHYQWGYDDAVTLDSTLIEGETNQDYANPSPVADRYYWVITSRNGCVQKSYLHIPTSANSIVNADEQAIKLFPNPAAQNINIEIQTTGGGNFRIEVLNMLGQVVNTIDNAEHNNKIDVAGLPAGCYLVDCYRNGVKTTSAKFIKN